MAAKWLFSLMQYAKKLHFQSVLIIQPIDMMADGEMNMCDGCPDMTVSADGEHWTWQVDRIEG